MRKEERLRSFSHISSGTLSCRFKYHHKNFAFREKQSEMFSSASLFVFTGHFTSLKHNDHITVGGAVQACLRRCFTQHIYQAVSSRCRCGDVSDWKPLIILSKWTNNNQTWHRHKTLHDHHTVTLTCSLRSLQLQDTRTRSEPGLLGNGVSSDNRDVSDRIKPASVFRLVSCQETRRWVKEETV